MAKIVDLENSRYLVVKGAPDKLIDVIKKSNNNLMIYIGKMKLAN